MIAVVIALLVTALLSPLILKFVRWSTATKRGEMIYWGAFALLEIWAAIAADRLIFHIGGALGTLAALTGLWISSRRQA